MTVFCVVVLGRPPKIKCARLFNVVLRLRGVGIRCRTLHHADLHMPTSTAPAIAPLPTLILFRNCHVSGVDVCLFLDSRCTHRTAAVWAQIAPAVSQRGTLHCLCSKSKKYLPYSLSLFGVFLTASGTTFVVCSCVWIHLVLVAEPRNDGWPWDGHGVA